MDRSCMRGKLVADGERKDFQWTKKEETVKGKAGAPGGGGAGGYQINITVFSNRHKSLNIAKKWNPGDRSNPGCRTVFY